MDQEGVTIRPLRHMLGEAEFNEVFLDDVYVPDDLRVGEVDGGWKVAMATLSYERVALATGRVNIRRLIDELITLIGATERDGQALGDDPALRRKVADRYTRARRSSGSTGCARSPRWRKGRLDRRPRSASSSPPRWSRIWPISPARSPALTRQLDEDDELDPWLRLAYQARGTSIAGGTTFIQRNIVAERVLGLPR